MTQGIATTVPLNSLAGSLPAATRFGPNLYATAAAGAHLPTVAERLLQENARSSAPAERIVLKAQEGSATLASHSSDAQQLNRLAERFTVQIDVRHFGQVEEFIPAAMHAKMAATGEMLAASPKPPSPEEWEERFVQSALIPDDLQSFQAGWKMLQEAITLNDPAAARAILLFLYDHDKDLVRPDPYLLDSINAAMHDALSAAALELLSEAQQIRDTERILDVVVTLRQLSRLADPSSVSIDVKAFSQAQEFVPVAMRAQMAVEGVMMAMGVGQTDAAERAAAWKAKFAAVTDKFTGIKLVNEAIKLDDPASARAILEFLYNFKLGPYHEYAIHKMYTYDSFAMQDSWCTTALELLQEPGKIQDVEWVEIITTILRDQGPSDHIYDQARPLLHQAFHHGTFDATDSAKHNSTVLNILYVCIELFEKRHDHEGVRLMHEHLQKPTSKPILLLDSECDVPIDFLVKEVLG